MRVIIEEDYFLMSTKGAYEIARNITNFKPEPKKAFFVLGLATGSTPIGLYKELVKMNKNGKLNFSNVATFNLDEYLLLDPKHEESYYHLILRAILENILNGMKMK